MEKKDILGCMNACGFKSELRERYLIFAENGQTKAQIRLLWQQRKLLMEDLHTVQKQVDCIDFIIRSLERTEQRKE
jgi:hypothetical protein